MVLGWIGADPPLGWVVVEGADVPADLDWLSAVELEVLRGLRSPKRRGDWLLGRRAAKRAVIDYLTEIGALTIGLPLAESGVVIVAAKDGAPEVVLADHGAAAPLRVSIAHSGGRALAVVGPAGAVFGVDIETIEPRSPEFIGDFFTAPEQTWLGSLEEPARAWGACLVWSAKEAVLKALRVGLREDTRAVEIHVPDITAPPAELPPNVEANDKSADPSPWRPLSARVIATDRRFQGATCVRLGQVLTILAEERAPGR